MIGSVIRLLVFGAIVALVTWVVAQLMETEGSVTIALASYHTELTPLAAAAAMVVASGGILLLVRLIDLLVALMLFMLGDPATVRRFTDGPRRRRAVEMLDRTMMALARGDGRSARREADQAARLLRRPGLARLMLAQASELSGDKRRARRYWRALAEEPATALVGIKGLLAQARATGDTERARALAERAAEIAPQDRQVLETLYALQSQAYDWAGARRTLAVQRRVGAVPRAEADRRGATLAIALAEEAEAARNRNAAKSYALEAVKLDPNNAEAAVSAARHLARDGHKRAAAKHLLDAWARAPSAAIARAFAEIEPRESPDARRRRFEKLFAVNPEHRESLFVKAELALMARDWPAARTAIEEIGERPLSARSCAIMAAIARGEGEPEAVVLGWLARALGAPREDGSAGATGAAIAEAAMLPLLIGDDGVRGQTTDGFAVPDEPGPEAPDQDPPSPGERETPGPAQAS